MERILIGVFDSKQEMDAACRELRDSGIPNDRVRVQASSVDQKLESDLMGRDRDRDVADSGFFQRLFGGLNDGARPGQYAEAIRRGGCAVIVDGIEESRVPEAVAVLERHGAFDIDERAAQWRAHGWKGPDASGATPGRTAGAGQMAASNLPAASQMTGRSPRAGTRIPAAEGELRVGKREVQRGGVRIYTRSIDAGRTRKT